MKTWKTHPAKIGWPNKLTAEDASRRLLPPYLSRNSAGHIERSSAVAMPAMPVDKLRPLQTDAVDKDTKSHDLKKAYVTQLSFAPTLRF